MIYMYVEYQISTQASSKGLRTLSAHIGMHTLPISACAAIYMLASSITPHKRDGLDQGMVTQKIDAISQTKNESWFELKALEIE